MAETTLKVPDFMKRSLVADYLNIGTETTPKWELFGTGFDEVNHSPNAQTLTARFVNEDSDTTITTGYANTIDFSFYEIKNDALIKKILGVARRRKLGSDLIFPHRRVYLGVPYETEAGTAVANTVEAFEDLVNVNISDENPRDNMLGGSGQLTYVAGFQYGGYGILTKEFTPDSELS